MVGELLPEDFASSDDDGDGSDGNDEEEDGVQGDDGRNGGVHGGNDGGEGNEDKSGDDEDDDGGDVVPELPSHAAVEPPPAGVEYLYRVRAWRFLTLTCLCLTRMFGDGVRMYGSLCACVHVCLLLSCMSHGSVCARVF